MRSGPRDICCLCLPGICSTLSREGLCFLLGLARLHFQSRLFIRLTSSLALGRGWKRHDLGPANNIPSPDCGDWFNSGPVTKAGPMRFNPGNFAGTMRKTKLSGVISSCEDDANLELPVPPEGA